MSESPGSSAGSVASSWQGWATSYSAVGGTAAEGDQARPDLEADAGDVFHDMLVDLKCKGSISAKQACLLSYWAGKAGAKGKASALSQKPGQQSGSYSRRFDIVVGAGLSSLLLFWMPVIRTHRFDASRRFEDLPVRLPHEALKSELNSSPIPLEALTRAVAEGDLPERYLQHPAVVAAAPGDLIHPFCLYMDGVISHGMIPFLPFGYISYSLVAGT